MSKSSAMDTGLCLSPTVGDSLGDATQPFLGRNERELSPNHHNNQPSTDTEPSDPTQEFDENLPLISETDSSTSGPVEIVDDFIVDKTWVPEGGVGAMFAHDELSRAGRNDVASVATPRLKEDDSGNSSMSGAGSWDGDSIGRTRSSSSDSKSEADVELAKVLERRGQFGRVGSVGTGTPGGSLDGGMVGDDKRLDEFLNVDTDGEATGDYFIDAAGHDLGLSNGVRPLRLSSSTPVHQSESESSSDSMSSSGSNSSNQTPVESVHEAFTSNASLNSVTVGPSLSHVMDDSPTSHPAPAVLHSGPHNPTSCASNATTHDDKNNTQQHIPSPQPKPTHMPCANHDTMTCTSYTSTAFLPPFVNNSHQHSSVEPQPLPAPPSSSLFTSTSNTSQPQPLPAPPSPSLFTSTSSTSQPQPLPAPPSPSLFTSTSNTSQPQPLPAPPSPSLFTSTSNTSQPQPATSQTPQPPQPSSKSYPPQSSFSTPNQTLTHQAFNIPGAQFSPPPQPPPAMACASNPSPNNTYTMPLHQIHTHDTHNQGIPHTPMPESSTSQPQPPAASSPSSMPQSPQPAPQPTDPNYHINSPKSPHVPYATDSSCFSKRQDTLTVMVPLQSQQQQQHQLQKWQQQQQQLHPNLGHKAALGHTSMDDGLPQQHQPPQCQCCTNHHHHHQPQNNAHAHYPTTTTLPQTHIAVTPPRFPLTNAGNCETSFSSPNEVLAPPQHHHHHYQQQHHNDTSSCLTPPTQPYPQPPPCYPLFPPFRESRQPVPTQDTARHQGRFSTVEHDAITTLDCCHGEASLSAVLGRDGDGRSKEGPTTKPHRPQGAIPLRSLGEDSGEERAHTASGSGKSLSSHHFYHESITFTGRSKEKLLSHGLGTTPPYYLWLATKALIHHVTTPGMLYPDWPSHPHPVGSVPDYLLLCSLATVVNPPIGALSLLANRKAKQSYRRHQTNQATNFYLIAILLSAVGVFTTLAALFTLMVPTTAPPRAEGSPIQPEPHYDTNECQERLFGFKNKRGLRHFFNMSLSTYCLVTQNAKVEDAMVHYYIHYRRVYQQHSSSNGSDSTERDKTSVRPASVGSGDGRTSVHTTVSTSTGSTGSGNGTHHKTKTKRCSGSAGLMATVVGGLGEADRKAPDGDEGEEYGKEGERRGDGKEGERDKVEREDGKEGG